jgi:hypothetical protein
VIPPTPFLDRKEVNDRPTRPAHQAFQELPNVLMTPHLSAGPTCDLLSGNRPVLASGLLVVNGAEVKEVMPK